MAKRSSAGRLATWGIGGVLLGAALAFLLLNLVARTQTGHEWVLGQTLKALGKGIPQGQLQVDRISGNLFEGAKLYRVSLLDKQGRPFITADSAFMEYDVKTLVSPRIVIDRLTLYQPNIWAFQMPGDSLWNYQAIFADTTPRDTTRRGPERSTWLGHIRLVNATAKVEIPFRADTTLPAGQQRRFIAQALADTSPLVVRQVPGGYLRTINLTRLNGVMREVRFAPGSEAGSRFNIDTLSGRVQFYRAPADIRFMRGAVALFRDHVEFDSPDLRFPASRLTASGVICFNRRTERCSRAVPEDELPYYDVAFRSDSVALGDFQWIYRRFPGDARGAIQLLVETRPEGTLFLIQEADLRTPRMRIAGDFGMILGDTLRFVDVDVEAQPVDVRAVERMLPDGLPVRGLVLGGAEIRGNRATPAEGDEAPAAAEEGGAAGEAGSETEARRQRASAPARRRPATGSAGAAP